LLVPDIAAEIKARNQGWGIDPAYVIDPAARIKAGPNQEQFTAAYAREGIFAAEGQNARGPGISEVKRRLQATLRAQNGEPAGSTLHVTENCEWLPWEFRRYRRDENVSDEWAAVKVDDHLLDALRYGVMAKTWVIPKIAPRRSNFNSSNPMVEPPWKGPTETSNPPLGAMS
jgi:hypothetical protein